MLEFIEYPKCSTCKKAKQELNQLGVDYKAVHIVEETPSQEVILNWLETSGLVEAIFQHQWNHIPGIRVER